MKLNLTEEIIARMGSNSLIGMLVNLNKNKPLTEFKEITLCFPESSFDYCQKHGGPRWMMIPEYVIQCIIPDIIWLTKLGIEIKIETYGYAED